MLWIHQPATRAFLTPPCYCSMLPAHTDCFPRFSQVPFYFFLCFLFLFLTNWLSGLWKMLEYLFWGIFLNVVLISRVCDIGKEDGMAPLACDSVPKAAVRIPEACRLQSPLPSLHRRHVLWHVVHREINMTLPPLLTPLKLNYWYSATKSSSSGCQYSLGIITDLIKKVIYALLCWHWAKTKNSAPTISICFTYSLFLSFSHSLLPLPEALTWKSKIDSVEIKRREHVGWNLQHYFLFECFQPEQNKIS